MAGKRFCNCWAIIVEKSGAPPLAPFTFPLTPSDRFLDSRSWEIHRRRSRSRSRSRSRIREIEEAEEEANHIKLNCFCSDEYPFRGTCKKSATSSHVCTYFTH
ncbi:hypothetical protein Tco_1365140 [Tanacetum coccineum]